MFEIPDDDDDNFWNDIPVDDRACSRNEDNGKNMPQWSLPQNSGSDLNRECSFRSKKTQYEGETNLVSVATHRTVGSLTPLPPDSCKRSCAPHTCMDSSDTAIVSVIKNTPLQDSTTCKLRENTGYDHVTPKRKRKFPGPAGILPRLELGQSLDKLLPIVDTMDTPIHKRSPHTSDDVFSDTPWQTLLGDLGEDGSQLLRKFSISSTLLKSGKKQLCDGKAVLLFGIIESITSHGSEASVSLRDRSGTMYGTIHRDLMKEHEENMHIGTVLVLKQVSIISISNRNHYLNITPNNVLALYHINQGSLKSLHFCGSQDSLHSVLLALERKAGEHGTSLESSLLTRRSSNTGSSRFNSHPQHLLRGRCGTPITSPMLVASTTIPSPVAGNFQESDLDQSGNNSAIGLPDNRHGEMFNRTTAVSMHSVFAPVSSSQQSANKPSVNQLDFEKDGFNTTLTMNKESGSNQNVEVLSQHRDNSVYTAAGASNSRWKFKLPTLKNCRTSPNNQHADPSRKLIEESNNYTLRFPQQRPSTTVFSVNNNTMNAEFPVENYDSLKDCFVHKNLVKDKSSSNSTDYFWEEDLTDEFLAQLSEELT